MNNINKYFSNRGYLGIAGAIIAIIGAFLSYVKIEFFSELYLEWNYLKFVDEKGLSVFAVLYFVVVLLGVLMFALERYGIGQGMGCLSLVLTLGVTFIGNLFPESSLFYYLNDFISIGDYLQIGFWIMIFGEALMIVSSRSISDKIMVLINHSDYSTSTSQKADTSSSPLLWMRESEAESRDEIRNNIMNTAVYQHIFQMVTEQIDTAIHIPAEENKFEKSNINFMIGLLPTGIICLHRSKTNSSATQNVESHIAFYDFESEEIDYETAIIFRDVFRNKLKHRYDDGLEISTAPQLVSKWVDTRNKGICKSDDYIHAKSEWNNNTIMNIAALTLKTGVAE